jgi:glucose/arabinose dehydrogenase
MKRTLCIGMTAIALLTGVAPARAANLAPGAPTTDFDLTTFASGLDGATDIAFLPDGRAVVTQRGGAVTIVKTNGAPVKAGTITVNSGPAEQGLLGVVVDPAFAANKTVYVYASQGNDALNRHKVLPVTINDDNTIAARAAIVSMGLEGPDNHNGGGLQIYKNQLYISVGDTGHNNNGNKYGTCLNKPNGKILRVNLDGSVPTDNPLVGATNVSGCDVFNGALNATYSPDTRIFAWGLRNPFRFWIDSTTGKFWIGDVGEGTREEIDVSDAKGLHFGWPFREGLTNGNVNGTCTATSPSKACTDPVFDYPHGDNNLNCIIGGLIPSGCGWAAPWTGRYIFGDHGRGRLWAVDVTAARDGIMPGKLNGDSSVSGSVTYFADVTGVAAIRMGNDGGLYVVSADGAFVSKITPKAQAGMNCTGGGAGGAGGTGAGGAGGTSGSATGAAGASGAAGISGGAGGSTGAAGVGGGAAGSTGAAGVTGGVAGTGGGSAGVSGTAGASGAAGGPGLAGASGSGVAGAGPGAGATSGGGCSCDESGGLPSGALAPSILALISWVRRRRRACANKLS